TQLTDEPGGVIEARYLPGEPRQLVIVALREGSRRLLLIDEDGAPPSPVDPAPGDQFLGGVSRDGKKLFYVVRSGTKASLRSFALDAKKVAEVVPPPPAAGAQRGGSPPLPLPLEDALSGLFALGPLSPDGRAIVALVRRSGAEAVSIADLQSARGDLLTPAHNPRRYPQ